MTKNVEGNIHWWKRELNRVQEEIDENMIPEEITDNNGGVQSIKPSCEHAGANR